MLRTTSVAVKGRAPKARFLTRTLGAHGLGILTLGCASNGGAPSPAPSSSDATETSSSVATDTSSSASQSVQSSSSDATDGSSIVVPTTETSSSVAPDTSSSATTSTETSTSASETSSSLSPETSSSGASDTSSSDVSSGNSGFKLTSPVLPSASDCSVEKVDGCATFPNENISYMSNANVSPAFEWTGLPEGTKSLAITLTDVTFGQPLWAIWNIPASASGLPANLAHEAVLSEPAGAKQANALFATEEGYFGPEAPCNLFEFRLFALSLETFSPTDEESGAEVDSQLNKLGDALLGRASLFGVTNYESMCEVVGTEG